MPNTAVGAAPIRFGTFELDVRAGELRRQGVRIKLQEQPLRILQMLLASPRTAGPIGLSCAKTRVSRKSCGAGVGRNAIRALHDCLAETEFKNHHRPMKASIVNARSGNALRTALSAVTKGTARACASATNSAS